MKYVIHPLRRIFFALIGAMLCPIIWIILSIWNLKLKQNFILIKEQYEYYLFNGNYDIKNNKFYKYENIFNYIFDIKKYDTNK